MRTEDRVTKTKIEWEWTWTKVDTNQFAGNPVMFAPGKLLPCPPEAEGGSQVLQSTWEPFQVGDRGLVFWRRQKR